jgi:antitoxin VapB
MNELPKPPKTAKLFKNGRSQAVRLPAEFRFDGSEVNIRRDPVSGGVLLFQKRERTGSLDAFFEALDRLGPEDIPEDFMRDREQGVQERDDPFA